MFGLKLLLHSDSVHFFSLYCFLGGGGGSVSCNTHLLEQHHASRDLGFTRSRRSRAAVKVVYWWAAICVLYIHLDIHFMNPRIELEEI